MTTHSALFVIAAATLVPIASAAAQQSADPPSEQPPAPPPAEESVRISVGGGYLHQFETSIDGSPGSVSIDRGYAVVNSGFKLSPALDLGIRLAWEGGWYDFDQGTPLSLGTGMDPWHSVQGVQVGGRIGWTIDERWSLSAGLFGGAAGEADADAEDSLSIGGNVAIAWRPNDRLMIGGGVLASSQIEDDVLVIPLLLVEWTITDHLRLSNVAGPEAYPTGAGLELVCDGLSAWEFGVGGRWESRRFRLDDSGPAPEGVGEDQGLGLWLRAGVRPLPKLRLDFLVGVMLGEELSLSDRDGNELTTADLDPSPFVGCFLSYRF